MKDLYADDHLLIASEFAKQLAAHLNSAKLADQYRDTPKMAYRLRRLAEQAEALAKEVDTAREDYDELDF